jgi:hypothetical protein
MLPLDQECEAFGEKMPERSNVPQPLGDDWYSMVNLFLVSTPYKLSQNWLPLASWYSQMGLDYHQDLFSFQFFKCLIVPVLKFRWYLNVYTILIVVYFNKTESEHGKFFCWTWTPSPHYFDL